MKKLYKKLLLILTCILATTTNANYSVSPVKVVIKPNEKITSLTFKNESDEEKNFQLTVLAKTASGEYQESKDLVAAPAIFKLHAGRGQLIRVAMKNNLIKEGSDYRLSIKELPKKVPINAEQAVRMVPDFRIPVIIGDSGDVSN